MNGLWSWVLMAVGVTGMWVAGRQPKVGWGIGVAAQVLWVAYALSTAQLGFLVSAAVYGSVYGLNWRRARRVEREATVGCPAA